MKLSTRGRYATRALMDIAMHQHDGPVTLRDIGQRQGISSKYLDQIVTGLRNAGLVRTVRGSRGGLVLARPHDEITALDVVTVVEGRLALVECVSEPGIGGRRSTRCMQGMSGCVRPRLSKKCSLE